MNTAKEMCLNKIGNPFADLHREGYLHIHDLEGYGKVYNCCTPEFSSWLSAGNSNAVTKHGKIFSIWEHIKNLIIHLATNQTGGIAIANFDWEVAQALYASSIEHTQENVSFLQDCVDEFIRWINTTYTRYCREPYYVTLNIGLDTSEWGRSVSHSLLRAYMESPNLYTRPNIVFKVKRTINGQEAPNSDLFQTALKCTAKRMIPTYLLTDSSVNQACDPYKLAIMGCRTRIYENKNGETGAIGRGNIACVSINLPRVALINQDLKSFYQSLGALMKQAEELLLNRAALFRDQGEQYLRFVLDNQLWNVSSVKAMIEQGTLSIGFIGIPECVEILTGQRPYEDEKSQDLAIRIVEFMREKTDGFRAETGMNFSLLASPGELLSGRFCQLDRTLFPHKVQEKGFYTNSFHVNVDAGVSIYQKLKLEAPYHALCNGGCITYVELSSAPLGNILALEDSITYATHCGISYLGFNFPYDICENCGMTGTFDICCKCGSNKIKRLRRVSGYLEDLSYFTAGKTAEVQERRANDIER